MSPTLLLSLIIFMPTIGAQWPCWFYDRKAEESMRYCALVFTAITFVLTLMLLGAVQQQRCWYSTGDESRPPVTTLAGIGRRHY